MKYPWMNSIRTFGAVGLLVSAGHSLAADPETQAQVDRFVAQLGAKTFLAREEATQRLLAIGFPAIEKLERASQSREREIRERAKRVLQLVNRRRRVGMLQGFSERKLSDEAERALPGWKRFQERYGDSLGSRSVMATMLGAEWELIELYLSEETETTTALQRSHFLDRYESLQQSGITYMNCQFGTALSFFFLASEFPEGVPIHDRLFSYMRMPKIESRLNSLQKPVSGDVILVKEMVSNWLIATTEAKPARGNPYTALERATAYRLDRPAKTLTSRILSDKNTSPNYKNLAMRSIVRRNDKSQIELLRPYLEDKTTLRVSNKRVQQLRDVALACVMVLEGHDVAKIGVRLHNPPNSAIFRYETLGYITEGDRQKAFETYRTLQAKTSSKDK